MKKALNRIMELLEVLQYASDYKPNHFTRGERIMIHQERAAWYDVLRRIEEGDRTAEPRYTLPAVIRKKVDEIITWQNIKK